MAFLGRTLHSANMLQYRDEHRGSRETWTGAIGRTPGRWHYLATITKSTKLLLVEKRETQSIFLSPPSPVSLGVARKRYNWRTPQNQTRTRGRTHRQV